MYDMYPEPETFTASQEEISKWEADGAETGLTPDQSERMAKVERAMVETTSEHLGFNVAQNALRSSGVTVEA